MHPSIKLEIELSEGVTALLRITVSIDPTIPTPNELTRHREPTLREMEAITHRLANRDYSLIS